MEPPEGSEETSWNVFGGLCVATSILDSKKHEKFLPLGPHKLRFSRHGSSIQRASLIPPRQEGQATQRSSAIFFFFVQPFTFQFLVFVSILVPFWFHFGSILSFGGCPETPWSPFASHLCPRTPQHAILGSFWEPPGTPFGIHFGTVFGSGPALDTRRMHFGSIFGTFGSLSVSTLFLNFKNDRKLAFFRVVDVAEV